MKYFDKSLTPCTVLNFYDFESLSYCLEFKLSKYKLRKNVILPTCRCRKLSLFLFLYFVNKLRDRMAGNFHCLLWK